MDRIEPLPVVRAASVELGAQVRPGWLVEGLWAADGVGVIGGAPKCCKMSVASLFEGRGIRNVAGRIASKAVSR